VNEAVNAFLLVYAGLFPIVNPVGGAPIFLGLTRHVSNDERHRLAGRVAFNGFLLLLGSLFVGSHVLVFFGITLPVVRIAGGLVVTAFAWTLLQSGEDIEDQPDPNHAHVTAADGFYPLTMPLTVGPGAISVAITLGSQWPRSETAYGPLAIIGAGAAAGLLAVAATIYVCYRYADWVVALLGPRGTNVMVRLSAFILLCIGIQILWTGWSALNTVQH
jgi:multiple antibiotic resistance protein